MSTTAIPAAAAEVRPTQIASEVAGFVAQAKAVKVEDQRSYNLAAQALHAIKAKSKAVQEWFADSKTKAYAAHQAICRQEADLLTPLREAEQHLKRQVADWAAAQERARREEEARQQAEAERLREQIIEQTIEQLEAAGASPEQVQQVIEDPLPLPPPVVQRTYQPAKGLVSTPKLAARVTNLRELCAAVARGDAPESYVLPNMMALNNRLLADREGFRVPGVTVDRVVGIGVRSA